ncbi:MAG: hypothetical protein ACRDT6_18460 [Micromonosporaceae bacterium]
MATRIWFELTAVLTLARHVCETRPAPALTCHLGHNPYLLASQQPDTAIEAVFSDQNESGDPATGVLLPLGTTGPDGSALIDQLRRASAHGAGWVSVEASDREPVVAFHTKPPRTGPPPVRWAPALVAIDDLLGPYPAQVRIGRTWNGWAIPRFSREVCERIAADTQRLAGVMPGAVEVVRVAGNRVRITRDGDPGGWVEVVEPDLDGMYGVGAMAWTWSVVDESAAACVTDCRCGTGCGCPTGCVVCGEPVDAGHATACPWIAGSAAYEQPVISPQRAVLDAHRHRSGCPLVRRRPGPLFDTERARCAYCGAAGGADLHNRRRGDTVEHHQRCTRCGQTWSAAGTRAAV